MNRRTFFGALFALLAAPIAALALAPVPFDASAFTASQAAGKTILVQIHADWCPQCAAQRPIIADLIKTGRFKDMVIYNIDFDTQKDLVRKFNAQRQSTLIVYKGATETGRSVGATQAGPITELLASGL
jgi:thiol-disulfide isomerase/thioredoxin